jgi:uncharacterized coiled-coil protein SlyX
MAAILKLRRGTSASPTLTDGEIFLNYTTGTIQFASGSGLSLLVSNLLPLDKQITGNIKLDGNITASSLYLTGDITARDFNGRNINLSGNIFLGDEVADNIVTTGQFSGSLIPSASGLYDLGSDVKRWDELHVDSAFIYNSIELPGSRIMSSSLGDYQDFDSISSSIDFRIDNLNLYTQSNNQRVNSIEIFTQSIDGRVTTLETTFSSSVDLRLDLLENFSSSEYITDSSSFDYRLDYIETTVSSSVDSRLDLLENFSSSEYIADSSSFDLRVGKLEFTASNHELRLDEIETTFSSSVDSRLDNLNLYTQSNDQRVGSIETFTQSVDLRVSDLEIFSGSEYKTDSSSFDSRLDNLNLYTQSTDLRLNDLELTGSNHELRLDIIETTFSSSVDSRLDLLENFSSSEYQLDSSSFDSRLTNLINVTGSYATTGSNTFIGNQVITGSLLLSGSTFTAEGLSWPVIGTETHLFKTEQYTVTHPFNGTRTYDYLGVALEQMQTGSWYENSLLFYTYDNHSNPTYGTEFLISPFKVQMLINPSGSDNIGRINLEEEYNGNVIASIQANEISIGSFYSSSIYIGETGAQTRIYGDLIKIFAPLSSSSDITASAFVGDGSSLTHGGTGILSSSLQDFTTFSSSVDSRLDIIEGPLSTSIDQQLNTIQSYTSSLKQAINVSGSDLTVLGNLLVQGTTTTINTEELIVKDSLLAIASGSTTSTESDGAGFFISGANASILWNDFNQTLDFNTKVSSSIGFKGDGSELINIPSDGIVFDGSGIVSGSSQIDLKLTTNYESGIKDRLDLEGVISESSQVNADSITNFDSNVEDYLVIEDVHRGSYLGTATTSDLDEGSNWYFTRNRFLTASHDEGLISGSSQITNGSNIVSSSEQISNYNIFLEIGGMDVVSGSSQIDVNDTQNFQNFSQSIDFRVNNLELTGSDQEVRLDNLEASQSYFDNTFSGSVDLRLDFLESTSSNHENRIIDLESTGSDQEVRLDNLEVSQSYFDNTFSGSVDLRLDAVEFTSSNQEGRVRTLESTVFDHENRISDIETTFSSSVDSRLELLETDQHTHSNKSQLDTIDQNLSSSDSPTFSSLSLTNLELKVTGSEFNGILYSSSGELVYSQFGDSIYYRVSQSIAFEDDSVIGTAGAMKRYIDEQFTIVGAGDITEVNAGDGLSGGALSGSATLTLDTASAHFTNGVVSALPSGVISGSTFTNLSSSFNSYTQSTDLRIIDLETTSSNQELRLDELEVNFSSSVDTRLDNLESFSSSIDVTIENKLNTEGVISGSSQVSASQTDNWSTDFKSELNSNTVISQSAQITNGSGILSSSVQNFDTFSGSVDTRLDLLEQTSTSLDNEYLKINGDEVISSSIQVDVTQTTNYDEVVQISGSQTIVGQKTFGGTQNFNNIVVNGTGSFAFIQSVTGTSTNIGEAFIVLNENTPASNFAGLKVIDSGSNFTTASFLYDGLNNQWVFEHEGSEDSGSAVAIFGPLSQGGLGTEQGLTENRIPKAVTDHGHHIGDSNITDNGTLITLGSNTQVNGNILVTGTVDNVDVALLKSDFDTLKGKTLFSGSSQVSMGGDLTGTANNAQITAGAITNTEVNATAGIVYTKLNLGGSGIVSGSTQVTPLLPNGTVSGSAQINHDSTNGFVANEHIDHSSVTITAGSGLTGGGDITANITFTVGQGDGISVSADAVSVDGTVLRTTGDGVVSGSAQITLTGDVTGAANSNTVGKIQGISITSGEATQLANIDTTTISTTQWGYLGSSNQGIATSNSPSFVRLTSTQTTGTAPFTVASTTVVTNLNADLLDGVQGASYARSDADDTLSGIITFSNSTASTSTTTGAVKVTGGLGVGGDVFAGGDVVAFATSDQRLKDEITPIENSLQKINLIGGYSFVWNEKQNIYKGKDYGVIAQEIESILPELVETRENGYKAVKYDRIVSLLIEGIKELSKEVSELKEKIGK